MTCDRCNATDARYLVDVTVEKSSIAVQSTRRERWCARCAVEDGVISEVVRR
jgi:hypothetical protein